MKLTAYVFRTVLMISGIISVLSCVRQESALEQALALAGDNRTELEKVLARYSANPETA